MYIAGVSIAVSYASEEPDITSVPAKTEGEGSEAAEDSVRHIASEVISEQIPPQPAATN